MTVGELVDGIRSGELTNKEIIEALRLMKAGAYDQGKRDAEYEQRIYEREQWERQN